jgi:hypothetical protein
MERETLEILEALQKGEISLEIAQNKLFVLFDVSESNLCIADIRNKLSPITHLITIIEDERFDKEKWLPKAIDGAKISVNYLAKREVYSR